MRIEKALAIVGVCLFWMIGGAAWAATDAQLSAECVECHDEDDLPDMSRNAHSVTSDTRTPTCGGCHGPSQPHLKTVDGKRPAPDRAFSKNAGLPPDERSDLCMTCHDKGSKLALWAGSQHPAADVACSSCHKIHTNQDTALVKRAQAELCYTCHQEQRVEVRRVSRHPILEGKMTCSDCHNVHGSAGPKLALRDSTNDTCYTCHAEYRGPFVHAHEPVAEDCAICHNPHGSTVAGMLVSRPPMLCQECHTPHVAGEVGAVGGQPGVFTPIGPGIGPRVTATSSGKNVVNMWQARSCMNCHTQVHGSNNPAATNPTPQFMFR